MVKAGRCLRYLQQTGWQSTAFGDRGEAMTRKRITPGLPSCWHEQLDPLNGRILYWYREHTDYRVMPVGAMGRDGHVTKYQVELELHPIGEPHAALTHAIVAAREHMQLQVAAKSSVL